MGGFLRLLQLRSPGSCLDQHVGINQYRIYPGIDFELKMSHIEKVQVLESGLAHLRSWMRISPFDMIMTFLFDYIN